MGGETQYFEMEPAYIYGRISQLELQKKYETLRRLFELLKSQAELAAQERNWHQTDTIRLSTEQMREFFEE